MLTYCIGVIIISCYPRRRSLALENVLFNSIQFNSKTLFKDGDPVSLKFIFPGAIQTCKQIQQLFIHLYKTTQGHRTITGKHNLHFHTKHTHKHSYLTYRCIAENLICDFMQIMFRQIITVLKNGNCKRTA